MRHGFRVWFHVYVRLRWRHWRSKGEACDWDCPWCPNPPEYEDRRIDVSAAEAEHLAWLRSRGKGVDGQPMRPGYNCPESWYKFCRSFGCEGGELEPVFGLIEHDGFGHPGGIVYWQCKQCGDRTPNG